MSHPLCLFLGPLPLARLLLGLLLLACAAPPVLAANYTVTADRDSWLNEGSTNQNNGTDATLRATATSTNTSRTRPVIGFTLPTLPPDEEIVSVLLVLRVTTAGTAPVNVYRITDTWAESTVTWANTAADFNATSLGSFTPSTNNAYVTLDITSTVSGWYASTFANHGVMLQSGANSSARFASRNNGTASYRPLLYFTTARIVPDLTVVKSNAILSDPYNGTTNPKAIPGAVATYTIGVANNNAGTADTGTTVVQDSVPATMMLYVGDVGSTGSGPVSFTNGAATSGLTYTFTSLASTTDSLSFSNNGGATFAYTPVPDANGYDSAVTNFRVNPSGILAGKTGATAPSFQLQLRMKVR
jgi:hypothetical protein